MASEVLTSWEFAFSDSSSCFYFIFILFYSSQNKKTKWKKEEKNLSNLFL